MQNLNYIFSKNVKNGKNSMLLVHNFSVEDVKDPSILMKENDSCK